MKRLISAILVLSIILSIPLQAFAQSWDTDAKYLYFGHYPQTAEGNDNTPIEWLVLAKDGQKALLLSRYGLDVKPYHSEYTSVTWETCTLRQWLNNDFLNKAFSAEEQGAILLTNVDNSKSQSYSVYNANGGNNTQDKVFLLSYAEASKYLDVNYWEIDRENNHPNNTARVEPTAYALQQGAATWSDYKTAEGKDAGWWWLRSPGIIQSNASHVFRDGSLYYYNVLQDGASIRPAMWVDVELVAPFATYGQ